MLFIGNLMKIFVQLLFLSIFSLAFGNSDEVPKEPIKLSLDLFQNKFLVLNFETHPEWHTYWKNPGDSGLPISPEFYINDKRIELSGLEWPAPQIFAEQEGEITTYGYKGRFSIFYQIPEKVSDLKVVVSWLACKNICIPGQKKIEGKIVGDDFVYQGKEKIFSIGDITKNFNSLPKEKEFPQNLDLILTKNGENGLVLFYTLTVPENSNGFIPKGNILYPLPSTPFNFRKENLYQDSKNNIYGRMNVDWDGAYSEPSEPLPTDGNFIKPHSLKFLFLNPLSNEYEVIEKTFSSYDLAGFEKSDEFFKILSPLNRAKPVVGEVVNDTQENFWYYLLFALLGGLLLNLMPCVLPVISLKIFYLIKHKKATRAQLIKHNLSYSLGIFFTFAVLAIVITLLKSTGEIIGWGFQLQSPQFISLIIFVLFVFSLNLFGLFHFITPGGKFLGNFEIADNYFGDFLSGILTTILATPCSAPFLGTALTFAFTSTTLNIFIIFGGIGLGLAMPFLLVGFFPKLISLLPKPGKWMEVLKQFLGLTILLTIVWLFDVFIQLDPSSHNIIYLGASLSFVFFAFYARKYISKNYILFVILLLLPGLIIGKLVLTNELNKNSVTNEEVVWRPWSVEKMEEVKSSGKYAFIDFSAKWCLTCKVNEAMVLNTDSFLKLAKENQVELLLADWTKKDKNITNFLMAHGKVGVPAYFILDKEGTLIDLGETISINEIQQYIK
jgi:cytochrome c biogenesis protein CcdA